MGDELGRDVLVARDDELRRAAPALGRGDDRVGVRCRRPGLLVQSRLQGEQLCERACRRAPSRPRARRPPRSARGRGRRAAARRSRRASCPRRARCRSPRRPWRARPRRRSCSRWAGLRARPRPRARAGSGRGRRDGARAPGSTRSHVRHVSMKPCRQTSGDPAPPRCDGVKARYTELGGAELLRAGARAGAARRRRRRARGRGRRRRAPPRCARADAAARRASSAGSGSRRGRGRR